MKRQAPSYYSLGEHQATNPSTGFYTTFTVPNRKGVKSTTTGDWEHLCLALF